MLMNIGCLEDYIIMYNRLITGEIKKDEEEVIQEVCNLLIELYSPDEVSKLIANGYVPDIKNILKELLEI